MKSKRCTITVRGQWNRSTLRQARASQDPFAEAVRRGGKKGFSARPRCIPRGAPPASGNHTNFLSLQTFFPRPVSSNAAALGPGAPGRGNKNAQTRPRAGSFSSLSLIFLNEKNAGFSAGAQRRRRRAAFSRADAPQRSSNRNKEDHLRLPTRSLKR